MKKFIIVLMVAAMASFLFTGCIPTVPVAVTGVTLDQATMTLTAGGATGTLVATVAPATATDKSVTWSSSALAVATVANGVVTPLTAGTTTITVTTVDGSLTATCAVTVQTGGVDATVAPIIVSITDNPVAPTVPAAVIDLTATATQYMNKAEVALGIIVNGTAPTYSEVKIYIDDICAGTANVGDSGTFSVVIAKADLGSDEDKVLYATAKEAALPVSPKSTEYSFTLDTVAPKATELKATAAKAAEVVDSAEVSGVNPLSALDVTGEDLTAGTWVIKCFGDSGTANNVTLTDPDGVVVGTYSINADTTFLETIPGVTFTLESDNIKAGTVVKIKVLDAIKDRATVLFDEDVDYATATKLANYTWANLTTAASTATTATPVLISKVVYFNTFLAALAKYDSLRVEVVSVKDLAGNAMSATSPTVLTCTVAKASLTDLAP